MPDHDLVITRLKEIEAKYNDHFERAGLSILDIIVIKGKKTLSVHVTDHSLPFEIRYEIETMFWVNE